MPEKLRVLILEDDPADCELNLRELRRAGYDPEWKRVETEDDFLSELEAFRPEIILSDFSMPRFNAVRAVELLRKTDCITPFIMISGTIGEDIAVEMMKNGASDYLLKDRLSRLGISVRKALEQKKLLIDKIKAEDEMHRVEDMLHHGQKMEALGMLAGGIAHDFNNILMPIIGYAEIGLNATREDTEIHSHLKEILAAARRAKELVEQILAFSRQERSPRTPVRPHLVVEEALSLLRSGIPATIRIVRNIDPDCGEILADPTEIHQIMMNLCTNAYCAMKGKAAVLTVALNEVCLAEGNPLLLKPGRYVKLEVADTGAGIGEDIIDRIFDPYFTTKGPEGTGLGLSIVYSIVKGYDGTINVKSKCGEGATFTIHIPIAKVETAAETDRPGEAPSEKRRPSAPL